MLFILIANTFRIICYVNERKIKTKSLLKQKTKKNKGSINHAWKSIINVSIFSFFIIVFNVAIFSFMTFIIMNLLIFFVPLLPPFQMDISGKCFSFIKTWWYCICIINSFISSMIFFYSSDTYAISTGKQKIVKQLSIYSTIPLHI